MSLVKAKKNPITGSLVIADVVLKTSGNEGADASQQDILRYCRAELDPHKVPTFVNIVAALNIGDSGKLVRHA